MFKLEQQIKRHPKVDSLEGREDGFADWFVELKAGWRWAGDTLPTHCFGAQTLTECLREIRKAIPCDCPVCATTMK